MKAIPFHSDRSIRSLSPVAASLKSKERLDLLVQGRGLAESREQAKGLILGGSILVDGQPVTKAGLLVKKDADIALVHTPSPYVSRGGLKLAQALASFKIRVEGAVAIDVGASTGGFTDCLLQQGAIRVYAVDVGYGQMAWRLRQDPRVVVLERRNIRYLSTEEIQAPVDLATVDLSFISLTKVIPKVVSFLKKEGDLIALVKPQFEVGRGEVGKGGIVRSEEKRKEVLAKICAKGEEWGLGLIGAIPSPICGKKGNAEYLVYFKKKDGE